MKKGSYEILDSGDLQKLEQVGPYKIARPSPQAVWQKTHPSLWRSKDAEFTRQSDGTGAWKLHAASLEPCEIEIAQQRFKIDFTSFGHLGIFPEQEQNWGQITDLTKQLSPQYPAKVLNLFGYTGGSSIAVLRGGGHVTHVDASPASTNWAKENTGFLDLPHGVSRFICEDVRKFVAKEVKRGHQYHGVILDPPTFGRGKKGEVWKIEKDLNPLLDSIKKLLVPGHSFLLLSSHTPGYGPTTLTNLVCDHVGSKVQTIGYEMTIHSGKAGRLLPSGACCLAKDLHDSY